MNYASKILNYLGEGNRYSQVLLVAGAPPVEKLGTEFHIVINVVLTPEDIRDTLSFFSGHARRSGAADMGSHGVFAFGMPKLGRFRVHYLTQRGSVFLSIQRMTFEIPALESLLGKPDQVMLIDEVMRHAGGGIMLFCGPSADTLSRLIYASLARINQVKSLVIYILEHNLSFLLRHRNSVVIQVEVGTDIPSLAEGLQNSLFLAPDMIYVRDPKTLAEYEGLMCAAETGAMVLISVVAIDGQILLNDLKNRMPDQYQNLSRLIRKTIMVGIDTGDKIVLHELPKQGA